MRAVDAGNHQVLLSPPFVLKNNHIQELLTPFYETLSVQLNPIRMTRMSPQERHDYLSSIGNQLMAIRGQLEQIFTELQLSVDRKAMNDILTDLIWASENCTVIALHQIGKAMDDAMGISPDGKVT